MSERTSEVAALRGVADDLMEARRYARARPDHAMASVDRASNLLLAHMQCDHDDRTRIICNLADGQAVILSDPMVLEGHLYAAARLLQSIARRLEKGEDA